MSVGSSWEYRVKEMLRSAGLREATIGLDWVVEQAGWWTSNWEGRGNSIIIECRTPRGDTSSPALAAELQKYRRAVAPLEAKARFIEVHPFMACNFTGPHVHVAY